MKPGNRPWRYGANSYRDILEDERGKQFVNPLISEGFLFWPDLSSPEKRRIL